MTHKLHCPFCGAELLGTLCTKYCPNEDCMCYSETISTSVWQALIDGKKAQEDSKCAKEELECVKHNYSVLSEQKEIAYQNYLKITGDLQAKLDATQEELTKALGGRYCGHCVNTAEASRRWGRSDIFCKKLYRTRHKFKHCKSF